VTADGNARVAIRCATEGASIGYRIGEQDRWLIYTRPTVVAAGDALQARAIRIGYKESEMVQFKKP
jgi:hypothetical protein